MSELSSTVLHSFVIHSYLPLLCYRDYSMELANPMSELDILELRLAAYRVRFD